MLHNLVWLLCYLPEPQGLGHVKNTAICTSVCNLYMQGGRVIPGPYSMLGDLCDDIGLVLITNVLSGAVSFYMLAIMTK